MQVTPQQQRTARLAINEVQKDKSRARNRTWRGLQIVLAARYVRLYSRHYVQ